MEALQTRYMTIELQLDSQNTTSDNSLKIPCNSGGGEDGVNYLSCDVHIESSVGFLNDTAQIVIRGMSEQHINEFTKANLYGYFDIYTQNLIKVYAGYTLGADNLPPLLYTGYTLMSAPDYNMGRDRPFKIIALRYFAKQQEQSEPINVNGTISVDNLFRQIATSGGYRYLSTGVIGTSSYPIYTGSTISQLNQATKDYGYYYKINDINNTVVVAKKGQPLYDTDHVINCENGMIGYPMPSMCGVNIKCYYNPLYQIGQTVTIQSLTLPYINNRVWYINKMTYDLQNKGEKWFVMLELNTYNVSVG